MGPPVRYEQCATEFEIPGPPPGRSSVVACHCGRDSQSSCLQCGTRLCWVHALEAGGQVICGPCKEVLVDEPQRRREAEIFAANQRQAADDEDRRLRDLLELPERARAGLAQPTYSLRHLTESGNFKTLLRRRGGCRFHKGLGCEQQLSKPAVRWESEFYIPCWIVGRFTTTREDSYGTHNLEHSAVLLLDGSVEIWREGTGVNTSAPEYRYSDLTQVDSPHLSLSQVDWTRLGQESARSD